MERNRSGDDNSAAIRFSVAATYVVQAPIDSALSVAAQHADSCGHDEGGDESGGASFHKGLNMGECAKRGRWSSLSPIQPRARITLTGGHHEHRRCFCPRPAPFETPPRVLTSVLAPLERSASSGSPIACRLG